MPSPGSGAASEAAVASTIAASALGNERAVCAVRVVLFSGILVRFLLVGDENLVPILITATPLLCAIGFSIWVLLAVKSPPPGQALWIASVGFDAVACFCSLLPNALWPLPGHQGVLHMPDAAAVLIATIGAGLRLSPVAAAAGGLLNAAGMMALVFADRIVTGGIHGAGIETVSLYVLFEGSAAAISFVLVWSIRRLIRRGAVAAVKADRASEGLGSMLADSHDLRSMICSASIKADLIASRAGGRASNAGQTLGLLPEQLAGELRTIGAVAAGMKNRAIDGLAVLGENEPVDVHRAVRRAVDLVASCHGDVAIEVRAEDAMPSASIAGGEPTFVRILVNLIQNACEGRNGSRPSRVWIDCEPVPERDEISIRVGDDGPGLPAAMIDGSSKPEPGKPGSSGVGLGVVKGLAEASGGRLSMRNSEGAGAEMTVVLPSYGQ